MNANTMIICPDCKAQPYYKGNLSFSQENSKSYQCPDCHHWNVESEWLLLTDIKPPLGLRPRCVSDAKRVLEILEAINRYIEVSKRVPEEWIDEFIELNDRLKI